MKLLLAVLYTKFVETECWISLFNFIRPADIQIEIRTYSKYSVAQGRNIAAKDAMNDGFDFIFFVDSDQILPRDTLIKLLSIEGDVRLAWTIMNVGSPDTNIAIYNNEKRHFGFHTIETLPKENVFEADGGGLAVSLIKTDIFTIMEYPYFRFIEYANGELLSEDLNFCLTIKRLGKSIKCDPTLKAGHIKHITI